MILYNCQFHTVKMTHFEPDSTCNSKPILLLTSSKLSSL